MQGWKRLWGGPRSEGGRTPASVVWGCPPHFWGAGWTVLCSPGEGQHPGSSRWDISGVLEAPSAPGPKRPRLPSPPHSRLSSPSSDTKKDLKQITNHLLDMLVSKKVSGQGRDQALNLLNKNVPRKDLSVHDNSRTVYVVDNGEGAGGPGRVGPGLPPAFPVGARVPCPEQKVEGVWLLSWVPTEKAGKSISILGSIGGLVKV